MKTLLSPMSLRFVRVCICTYCICAYIYARIQPENTAVADVFEACVCAYRYVHLQYVRTCVHVYVHIQVQLLSPMASRYIYVCTYATCAYVRAYIKRTCVHIH